jgi:transglutaminase-like putative cysteine protease
MSRLPVRASALAALALAAFGFSPLLSGLSWLFVAVAAFVLVAAAGAVVDGLARRRFWAPIAELAAVLVVSTVFFAPASALLLVVPTPGTVAAFVELGRQGIVSIQTQGTPADPVQGIVFLLTVGLALLLVLVDLLSATLRLPALAGIPLVVIAAVPGLIEPTAVEPVFLALLAVAYLSMLLTVEGRRARAAAIAIGATAVVASLVITIALPTGSTDPSAARLSGYSTGVNPFISLGEDLTRPDPVTAFTYTTDSDDDQYFTLTVLEDFSGQDWEPDPSAGVNGVEEIAAVPGRPEDAGVTATQTAIQIGNIRGRWLPVPWAPRSITDLTGDWSVNPRTLAVRTEDASIARQDYSVDSALAAPTVQQLQAAGTRVPSDVEDDLDVPASLPGIVATTAREVTAGASSHYDMAIALQKWFRSSEFEYSTEAPVEEGYDGSSAEVVGEFLERRAGYCVHFSSAMALMARTLGIPARIGVGFISGRSDGVDEDTRDPRFEVTTDDLHAWPELYFDGVGWVRFEPTPGRGYVPSFDSAPSSQATSTAAPDEEDTPTPTPTATRSSAARDDDSSTAASSAAMRTFGQVAQIVGIVLAVIVVLLVPWGIRSIRRLSRLRRVRRSGSPFAAWREVQDAATDVGIRSRETDTPRGLAERIEPLLDPGAREALRRVLGAVESSAFSATPGRASASDVSAVVSAVRASAKGRARWLATLLPASVVRPRFTD